MAGKPKFNAEETDTIVRHYLNGMSLRKLAQEMNSSVPTIRKYVASRVSVRPRGRPRLKKLMAFDKDDTTLPTTSIEKVVVDNEGRPHSVDLTQTAMARVITKEKVQELVDEVRKEADLQPTKTKIKKIADFPTRF